MVACDVWFVCSGFDMCLLNLVWQYGGGKWVWMMYYIVSDSVMCIWQVCIWLCTMIIVNSYLSWIIPVLMDLTFFVWQKCKFTVTRNTLTHLPLIYYIIDIKLINCKSIYYHSLEPLITIFIKLGTLIIMVIVIITIDLWFFINLIIS